MTTKELENRFSYHTPTDEKSDQYEHLNWKACVLAAYIDKYCPDSREKSLALTKIEEAVMWATAAIARNE